MSYKNFTQSIHTTWPDTKEIDLTGHTEDPGNTKLIILIIPTEYDDQDEAALHLKNLIDEHLTSEGDYFEEASILYQNNETVVTLNLNK